MDVLGGVWALGAGKSSNSDSASYSLINCGPINNSIFHAMFWALGGGVEWDGGL